jgi:hypothetical protein
MTDTIKAKVSAVNKISTTVNTAPTLAAQVKSLRNAKIEDLTDVDTQILDDNYTLVYNEITKKWVATLVTAISPSNVDGGTY